MEEYSSSREISSMHIRWQHSQKNENKDFEKQFVSICILQLDFVQKYFMHMQNIALQSLSELNFILRV